MKPWVTIGTAGPLVLQQRDDEFVIRSRGIELMSSRRHASEDAMAEYAVGKTRVLIGGLGLGFTLRAVLAKNVPNVMIAELEPAVVEWNRGPFGNAALLSDPRVHLHVGD